MSWESPLSAEFKRLRRSPDPQQRGRKLEELLERLFQQAHFRVKRNAGIARPRQTDLVASYGDLWYLIEAKWENTPADVDVFDTVRARIERAAAASVVGVIVCVSGFTKNVVEEVVNFRGRQPVLLLGEEEGPRLSARPSLCSMPFVSNGMSWSPTGGCTWPQEQIRAVGAARPVICPLPTSRCSTQT